MAGARRTAGRTAGGTDDGCRARRPSPRLLALPLALAAALAGCAAGEGLDGSFGAQDTGVVTAGGAAGGVVNSSTTGSLTIGSGANVLNYDCPVLTVRTGASTWQVTDGSGGALRYQATVGKLARECSIVGNVMQLKIGIEGRVLLGEKGSPGQIKVPIRIAVVQEGPTPKTIATKFFTVAVDVPADPGHTAFTVVEDQVSFPLLKPAEMERYVIYVGFDPQGSESRERPRSAPAAAARPRPRPKPAAETSEAPAAAPAPAPAPAATSAAPAAAPKPAASGTQNDVFGPPPSSGGFTPPPSTGGFSPPPSTSTFSPPPK